MVARNLNWETQKLLDKQLALGEELNVIIQRLCRLPNLVASEAFPMSDIAMTTMTADQNRILELRNDQKEIMQKIMLNLRLLCFAKYPTTTASVEDSVKRSRRDAAGASSGTSSSAKDVDLDSSSPFVVVDEIGELSPAAEDGLQLGDQILEFGNLERGENLLLRLAAEVRQKQGEAVPLVVMRQGSRVNVTVTPRTWLGHGLLGCRFRILRG